VSDCDRADLYDVILLLMVITASIRRTVLSHVNICNKVKSIVRVIETHQTQSVRLQTRHAQSYDSPLGTGPTTGAVCLAHEITDRSPLQCTQYLRHKQLKYYPDDKIIMIIMTIVVITRALYSHSDC
jgi:hypothetical protein